MINKLKNRIKELKEIRESLTGSGSRTKYNFAIGEIQGIIQDLEDENTS